MPVKNEVVAPPTTQRAGERVQVYIAQAWWDGTGLQDVIPKTASAYDKEVTLFLSEETRRAQLGLEGHLAMLRSLSGWHEVPADHVHPQLRSEPDD